MADEFAFVDTSIAPARNASAVTPHATNALANVSKALWVGTGGDLVVRCADDDADVTIPGVPSGSIIPVRVTHVRATSPAAGIVNLY